MKGVGSYAHLSDKQWIDVLLKEPKDEQAVSYFVTVKCRAFLAFIAKAILHQQNNHISSIISDFYIFLSQNDWYVIRMYRPGKNTSLNTYLSLCTCRYFIKLQEKKNRSCEQAFSTYDLNALLSDKFIKYSFEEEEREENCNRVWEAFHRLNQRDKDILRLHVIENKPYIEIADAMWQYIHTQDKDWRKLPIKRVQDTLSLVKKRALFNLYLELCKSTKKE